ncbi:hypothetical protein CFC21_039226 [Triticum aestivum]|uniref:Bowman-Birk serine protease inhibitors family domain-containing protein n=3 Tax=Triticum TaxID=4564 RepID=A0A9R1JRN3_WHEAT|nr:Bowman-Birk type trypsin inhibitor-like [Triticum aestivum]VAH71414.1 unnamed protein product [Triticum turgidum subsp. durum]KAF7027161.1 hypothetical protein CFC21_039226 [Triticum aestivum]CDM80606.1 unnamed protein product [Triticum aestivum]VAH71422.1 unnamed protein product [Triticum turgidum subsp. durum]BDI54578.1 Bowman-Birk type trypsin inhibitor-like [Triticum aestivum]
MAMGGRRPWKCCDQPICRGWKYPVCECADEVDECAPTCHSCVPSKANATRKVCEDTYIGKAGPGCTEKPWKCCDEPFCSGADPPTCHCADEVEQCAPTCKTCLPALLHPWTRHMCFDFFHGFPGPQCRYLAAADDAAGGGY